MASSALSQCLGALQPRWRRRSTSSARRADITLVAVRRPLTSTTWVSPARAAMITATAATSDAGTWRRRPSAASAITAARSVSCASSRSVPVRPEATLRISIQ
ncbi:MAG: hypothetical protein ACJ75A_23630, partial [Actinomycetes bacterium]